MTTNISRQRTRPLSVPVGYRFHPTEEELLNHFLKKKIQNGNDSEVNQTITEIDLCKYEPWDLPALLGTETEAQDMEWFFFTRKAYKYSKSPRSNRCTTKGFWKITGKERGIKARGSKSVIGKKRTLTFYHGRAPESKKTNWVIHEYYFPGNEVVSHQKQGQGVFVICRLKNKSDKKYFSVSNWENEAPDEMNQEAPGNGEWVFHQPQPQPRDDCCSSSTSQELEAVLQINSTNDDCNELQSPFGDINPCLVDGNEVSICDEDETLYDVYPQLRDQSEENLDSLLGPHQEQGYCPSKLQSPIYTKLRNFQHPLQPQDYQPSMLQSPIYTKLGNVPDANLYYGECNNLQPAIKKRISTNEVDLPVTQIMSNSENQATDYRILEVHHSQTEDNLDSAFTKFLNTIFDQEYYSSDQTAHTPFENSKSPGMVYHGDSGVSNDTDTEVAHGWIQCSSAIAMGHTLQCS